MYEDSKSKNKGRRLKELLKWLAGIPLVIGFIGFRLLDLSITDALYSSIQLYAMGWSSGSLNLWIEVARWMAPFVTATAILCVLQNVWKNICWRLDSLAKDNVAVYSDEALEIKFARETKVIYPGDDFKGYMKSHIIFFSSDQKSLKFFEEHKKELENKKVYIGLRELEQGLMDISDTEQAVNSFQPFDLNHSISRQLWKQIALWRNEEKSVDVVIYGNSPLASELLYTGLQLNLFSQKQHIRYYLISDNLHFQVRHRDMSLMNEDEIFYYGTGKKKIWNIIEHADYVIISDEVPVELLQTMVVKSKRGKVYYYSPEEGDAGKYISFRKPIPFGRYQNLLTDENIRQQKLIQSAIQLNEQYALKYHGENNWNKLSGFLKESNISSADFNEVLAELPVSASDMELAELEHIRWCRFYYLNYWEKGNFTDGTSKDNARRLHKDLIPFDELDEREVEKDLDVVKMARSRR